MKNGTCVFWYLQTAPQTRQMTKIIYHTTLATLMLLLGACGKKRMGVAEYQHYVEDAANGLTIERDRNGIHTVFSLYPHEWQSFRTAYAEAGTDKAVYERLCAENAGILFFSFRVFLPGHMSLDEYLAQRYENAGEALLYVEQELKNDFTLLTDTDSLACTAIHRQPGMGLRPYEEFTLLFDTGRPETENMPLRVRHTDRVLGLDSLTYAFDAQTMNNIPILQLK